MYELTKWDGQLINETIMIDSILVDDPLEDLLFRKTNTKKAADVFDVEFEKGVNKADRYDYLFALFSGTFAYGISKLLKEFQEEDEVDDQKWIEILSSFLKDYNLSEKAVEETKEKIIEVLLDAKKKIDKKEKYVSALKDFSSGLSYRALIISIAESVLGIKIWEDEQGKIEVEKIDVLENEVELSLLDRIEIGIINWITNQIIVYKLTGQFKEESDDIIKIISGMPFVSKCIKDWTKGIKVDLLKDSNLKKWINKKNIHLNHSRTSCDSLKGFDNILVSQINNGLVNSYIFLRHFLSYVDEHNISTLEGLEVLDYSNFEEENHQLILRINTVSTGTFSLLNLLIDVGGEFAKKDKKINRILAAINIPNILRFKVLLQEDMDSIIEDVKKSFNRSKIVEIHKQREVPKEELEYFVGLNSVETKLLYSLELHLLKEDIQATKENSIQIKKNNWRKEWMKKCEESLELNKLFEENPRKVYQAIATLAANTPDLIWLYKIALELALFKPYYLFDKDDKDYKGLKLSIDYIEDIFCENQTYITSKEMKEFTKCYQNYKNTLGNNSVKIASFALGTLAITAATGFAAFAFAPQIAVALLGGAFPTLHGAALTSASLAMAGGGALAVGGLGMAGGTAIIASGGVLLGLGSSGVAATTFTLLSNPDYVQNDYAKLLTKCEYVYLNKYSKIDEVHAVSNQIKSDLSSLELRLSVLKNTKKDLKEYDKLINDLEKSYKAMGKTAKLLEDLLEDADKKS